MILNGKFHEVSGQWYRFKKPAVAGMKPDTVYLLFCFEKQGAGLDNQVLDQ